MESTVFKKVSRDEFIEKIVLDRSDSLVKFSSKWSGSAELLKHIIEDIATKYKDKLNFFHIDADVESDLSDIYHIEASPTLLFFRKGTLVDKLSGLVQKSVISNKIEQIIN